MKLVFLTVSLVTAFTVEPGPDSQHSGIGGRPPFPTKSNPRTDSQDQIIGGQPQWSDSQHQDFGEQQENLKPDYSEETAAITAEQPQKSDFPHAMEGSIITEPQFSEFEAENEESESELRGSKCKPKDACTVLGGNCTLNTTSCKGWLWANGCKGSCQCCVPECPAGYFMPPGSKTCLFVGCPEGLFKPTASNQCFKLFTDQTRNWTESYTKCSSEGLVQAHPNDAIGLRDYLVQTYGSRYHVLGARGDGSYYRWQDNGMAITKTNPLWWTGQPSRNSSDYCLRLESTEGDWKSQPEQPYYTTSCSSRYYTLCSTVMI